jgi:Tc5 transposase DNA-binding domain/DDE superfamily endonuclease
MADFIDEAVKAANKDLIEGIIPSIGAAAAVYSIPRTTLDRRLNDGLTRRESHSFQQLLSIEQDERLVQWVLDLEKQGHTPTHKQVREVALQISIHSGGPQTIGHNLVSRFLRRQPILSTKIGRIVDALRVQNTDPNALRTWYTLFKKNVEDYNIHSSDIWDMDETGLALGACLNVRIIGSSSTKKEPTKRHLLNLANGYLYSKQFSAEGEFILPLVIFKGKNLQSSWFRHDSVPDCRFITSEDAYTPNEVGLKWLKDIFLPKTVRYPPRPRLLLTIIQAILPPEFLRECHINQVYIVFLIPHTSHFC